MKPKVFVTRPLPIDALSVLQAKCDLVFHGEDTPLSTLELAHACHDAGGLIVAGTQVNEEVLEAAPALRVVANAAVGYDNINVSACTRRGILVTNTPGVLTDTTADLTFALLLAVSRRVVECDRFVREGSWRAWRWGLMWGADIHHKTLGIWGFGRIGQAVAHRGRGFSMRLLYHARHRVPEAVERELQAEYVNRETLLRESDFLTLHVPLTPETRSMVGRNEFSLMKPTAFLVNTARGALVDEGALVEALRAQKIAGAGLDVFEREPQVHPGLITMNNVVLTPHAGSASGETRFAMARLAAENLLAALNGERPPNLVNPEVYSAETAWGSPTPGS